MGHMKKFSSVCLENDIIDPTEVELNPEEKAFEKERRHTGEFRRSSSFKVVQSYFRLLKKRL